MERLVIPLRPNDRIETGYAREQALFAARKRQQNGEARRAMLATLRRWAISLGRAIRPPAPQRPRLPETD